MSSLTRLALKRPVSSLLIVLALLVFGIGSVFGFKMELTPDMEMPMLFVQTIYQGGDPATTEELVTKIIEDAGKTLSGVESVTSQTTEYISFVMFSYEYGIDIDEAYADLRSALDTASLQLPDDAQDPVIYEMDMNAQDMMTLSVTSTGDTDVLAFVEDELRPELERLSDVAQITVSGGEQDYIRIQLHRDKMQQYGVTMANVRSYIAATDFTVPIGSVDQGAQSISTSASSKPANLMDLQNVPIITARGTTIALSDIATVSMSARANSSISRYNGQDSISIGIAKVQSEGTVDVSNHVKSLVERVAAKNSAIQISVAYDAADSIKSSLSSVAETLVLGVLFSTITTVVVYLPLATMKGLAGQLFSQLGYTIIFAMLSSLIVAITLIPIFFWKYRPKEKKDTLANQIVGKIGNGYKTLLKHIMLKKKTVMLVAVGLLALAFVLAGQLDQELMSATGIDNMSISIEQRAGTRLEVMDENIRFIEQMIIDDTDFAGCNLTISGSSATITAYPSETCEKSINQLVDIYNEKLLDSVNMSVIVSAGGSGMTSMMSVMSSTEVDLVGDNIEDLRTAARQVDTILMDIPGIIKTSSNLTSDAAQAKIQIDPLKCMNVGLTAVQVAGEMYNASSGIEVMDMTIGTEEYSVRMEYPDGSYADMNQLLNLEIATPTGSTITVGDVAEAVYSDVPNTLMREDGKYQVAITAYTTDAMKYTAKETIVAAVEAAELRGEFPEGVSQTQNMMDEMLMEEFTAIGKAIFTAVFLIFLVMAMQFESPVFSLMVMLSIPFSLIGSFFLLFITGSTLNMTSLMGVLMLVGIVVNNGILYVDTTNQLKEEMPLNDALMESGRLRLRPILMTTLTTILSMIPMIFAQNENAAMMKGMSLIIIGGLVTSTLLILLLLPSFYLLMSKQGRREAKERRQMKRQKKLAEKDL